MCGLKRRLRLALAACLCAGAGASAGAASDPYVRYLTAAPEFQRVPPPPRLADRWQTWLYMPWRHRWTIGTDDAGGRFAAAHGINGAVADHGRGPLAWFTRWGFQFYVDHLAGKGDLFLIQTKPPSARDPRALRRDDHGPKPLDRAMIARLQQRMRENIAPMRESPLRIAYALDDEISWGVLTRPLPWRVLDDEAAYARWLASYYGTGAPAPGFAGPDQLFEQLDLPLARLDFSPLLDRLSYNDSVWANLLGALVGHANLLDPETPAGFVGAQSPSAFGGYDYAKLMKKVQFLEPYDLGSAPAIARSFSPGNALPRVATHFHRGAADAAPDRWQAWSTFAHGGRGMIGWVEDWFDGAQPRPWLRHFAPTLRELSTVQGAKMKGATWLHDGVALYYSQPSIQVSWLLDSEAHGRSWPRRNDDHRLGTSHLVRQAWERLLTDWGVQYDFVSYDTVATIGVPAEYRVLILPACFALSDAEAKRIAEFAAGGGTVIADFGTGLFDQHGRGRKAGALDSLFGLRHDGRETRANFFGGRLWVETDQERGYGYRRLRELFSTVEVRQQFEFAVAEPGLPVRRTRQVGRGRAVYLNLSPQRYLMYREEGRARDSHRRTFLDALAGAGVAPWIRAGSQAAPALPPLEIVYWSAAGRTLVLVVQAAESRGGPDGRGAEIRRGRWPLDLELAQAVNDVRDERGGRSLGAGRRFQLPFDASEAVFFSFRGGPPPGGRS